MASEANDISETGAVVGLWVSAAGRGGAFMWTDAGGMRSLALPDDILEARATGVNGRDEVVGYGVTSDGARRALYWSATGEARAIAPMHGDSETIALGINEQGDVVGASGSASGPRRAFKWNSALMRDLGVLPGMDWSIARAIADNGDVVGSSGRNGSPVERGFVWSEAGGMRDLGAIPADAMDSGAYAVNARGDIVGFSWNGSTFRAVKFPRQP